MEWKELEKKSAEELRKMLEETRERVRDLRFKISQDQWKKVRDIREEKKTVARILTLLRAKETSKQ